MKIGPIGILAAVLLGTFGAEACSTCFGAPDAAQTKGMNNAILTLVGIAVVVVGTMGTLILRTFWRIEMAGEEDK